MGDSVSYDQNMVGEGGGEIMELMMTGGDNEEMNEETLQKVITMLNENGQLTGGNHTIIIRQPGSNDIQLIQTSNGGDYIVSKASEEDIQALQAGNGILDGVNKDILEEQQGQMVMLDEGGHLVEGVVNMQDGSPTGVMHLTQDGQLQAITDAQTRNLMEVSKNGDVEASEILEELVQMDGIGSRNHHQSLLETSLPTQDPPHLSTKPITITTTTSKQKPKTTAGLNGEVVSIKINTGLTRKKENKPPRISPKDIIKISTVTGQQKYQPPKFHKCEACAINFVSKVAYMNHMEGCPSKRKSLSAVNNKGHTTYTCVFCEMKFTSRLVLMQHVRVCEKAKSKPLAANAKLKVTTSESKLKLVSSGSLPKSLKGNHMDMEKKQKKLISSSKLKENKMKLAGKRKTILDFDDESFLDNKDADSDYEDEKNIVYDDDDDLNEEEFLGEDDNIEETLVNKRSQKHLGPIIVKGMFKCRDCNRTFSKEYQYNRHVKACTNAPLNASKIDTDGKEVQLNTIPVGAGEAVPTVVTGKRKRGRPPSKDYSIAKDYVSEDIGSPAKKRALGVPKIVSVNPKKVGSGRGRPRFMNFSDDNESDEDIISYLSGSSSSRIKEDMFGKKNEKISQKSQLKKSSKSDINMSSSSPLNKIVKISPTDTLIKQTGKAMLSKLNKEKCSKMLKDSSFCGLCGDKFSTVQELSIHMQICHSEDLLNLRDSLDGKGNLSSVKCPMCDLHFVSPHILLLHMVSFHEKDLKLVQDELVSQNLNLICPFCNDLNLTQDLLKEHIAIKHLDRLINKPSSTVSPMTLDVHAFIKEKNNGSILPTSKLLVKKEKVLCPECGLFFFKSYFEHHRCAAETYSSSARKFICSESQCSGLSFYKLIHLLTHLHQVHEKSLSCKEETFDSVSQFLEWLKREEMQTKMKFTKALQRMKQGKLSTVWICHRFHNSMKDPTSITGDNEARHQTDRLNQCYSRIHTETSFNPSTSRYDGKTSIKYYPTHQHPSENEVKDEQYQKPQILHPPPNVEKQPVSLETFTPVESAFSDAAELKQLLEDDEVFNGQKGKPVDTSFDAQQLARFVNLDKDAASILEAENSDLFKNNFSKSNPIQESENQDELVTPNQTLETIDDHDPNEEIDDVPMKSHVDKILNEEESLPSSELSEKLESKDAKEVSGLVSLSDADLLLEKMLGEHDGGENSSVDPMDVDTHPSSQADVVSHMENLAPTEAKITDVDMLEAFGECITPEESSNSTTSNTLLHSVSSELPEQEQDTEQDMEQETEQVLDQEVEQVLDQEVKQVLDQKVEQVLDQEVEQVLDQEVEQVLDQEVEQVLDQEVERVLDQEVERVLDQEVEQVLDQDVEQVLDQETKRDLEQVTKKDLEHETKLDLEQETEQELEQETEPQQSQTEQKSSSTLVLESEKIDKEAVEIPQLEENPEHNKPEEEVEENTEEEEEESTYVLPADYEEWSKLFELVSAQVSSKAIPDAQMEEAETLLGFENSIMDLEIEKQIEIFNRLCSLANVQMT